MDLLSIAVVLIAAFGMTLIGFAAVFIYMCSSIGFKKAIEVMKRGLSIQ